MRKLTYFFGAGRADGDASMKDLLGGKGANLAEMSRIGLPIPAGFTITTEVCTYFTSHGGKYPQNLEPAVLASLKQVEHAMGKAFGGAENPLLVSVRSGARASMPGMMDTVLNIGLNDLTVKGLAEGGNERFAYDCYRRLVQMYGDVVLGLKPEDDTSPDPFETIINERKAARGITKDTELEVEDLKHLVAAFKQLIKRTKGVDFPEDPYAQLWGAIDAVFKSWNNRRAIEYRRINSIPDDWGTAVNVQAMVFGNIGWDSGTGVAFTRNPATGENVFYGEYLLNAQGEDVVAGIRTPQPINEAQRGESGLKSLEAEMPGVYKQLLEVRVSLEAHFKDMQDLEFTIERGRLWVLQTRSGKRTGLAALEIAFDMHAQGLINREMTLMRIEPEQLNHILRPVFDAREKEKARAEKRVVARGLNAGPGAASGKVVFSSARVRDFVQIQKVPVVLVREETSPEDVGGMNLAQGVLTARGGMTSHAALVARQLGKVCVVGCEALSIDYDKREMTVAKHVVKEGDDISIDGSTGEVIIGKVPTIKSEIERVLIAKSLAPESSRIYNLYKTVMDWSDEYRRLKVRANADQPDQAAIAVAFGCEGIGLCRTEHMFFAEDRINKVRQMIMASTAAQKRDALAKIQPLQQADFKQIFRVMVGKPVTIRLLDPPLHEFLPKTDDEAEAAAREIGVSKQEIMEKSAALSEFNPMLGNRGCRLGITYPEIYDMQVKAIAEAACDLATEGIEVVPEIMVPLVGDARELSFIRERAERVVTDVMKARGVSLDYMIGTMIEIPRACVTAHEVAKVAEFFSFGTNDLTQMTYGLSRDDAGKVIRKYIDVGIMKRDVFESIDTAGVGGLMRIAVEKAKATRQGIKLGICGEHGGEPSSIDFCEAIGLDYVSCSPFRVPVARLA
ncbi:MAG TPA: pyruvate, phosphate dikinase, partial [bacterium]|nr:pyruvate, phosphate dikinase [bacterium]